MNLFRMHRARTPALLLLAFAACPRVGAQAWSPHPGPLPDRHYYGIYWDSAGTEGTLVGSGGVLLRGSQVFLAKGAAPAAVMWQSVPSGTLNALYGTHRDFAVGAEGTIVRRGPTGAWDTMTTPTTRDLYDVHAVSASAVYAVGAEGTILKWPDSTGAWAHQNSETGLSLRAVQFVTPDTGYVAGDGGMIRKTINGGEEWFFLPSGTLNNLHGLHFTHRDTGYVVGDSGTIRKTTDGGLSWQAMPSGTLQNLRDVRFARATIHMQNPARTVDTAVGCAVGEAGMILWTGNGGQTWSQEASGTSHTLRAVHVFGGWTGTQSIAAGESRTVLEKDVVTGSILSWGRGSAGARVWMPGPGEVRFVVRERGPVRIRLLDLNGRLLAAIDAGVRDPGEHGIRLGTQPPAGLAILELRAGEEWSAHRLSVP